MSRKKSHSSVIIDMTPLVDVCMLLLTFFMLTTQFRPPTEAEVILPSSHSAFELPQSNVMTVTLSKDERIFLEFENQKDRVNIFGEEYKLRQGSEVEKDALANLLIKARIGNPKLITVIRGDKETPYGLVEDVMDILQKTKITRFSLVTELETK